MHRFYLPPGQCQGPTLELDGHEAHHALRVLRLRSGDKVSVLNGVGTEFQCEVAQAGKRGAKLKVLETRTSPARSCEITLLQAVPKGKIIESIIQKATELGIARIVPILSERVVTHLDVEGSEHKADKWQHVAIEAIKQCGSPWLPQVEAPVTPAQFLSRNEQFELPLIASLQPERRHPRLCFDDFHNRHGRKPKSICIWIGPEGDLTPTEVETIVKSGALPITLGPHVLRVETAAIYSLSIINYELQSP